MVVTAVKTSYDNSITSLNHIREAGVQLFCAAAKNIAITSVGENLKTEPFKLYFLDGTLTEVLPQSNSSAVRPRLLQ